MCDNYSSRQQLGMNTKKDNDYHHRRNHSLPTNGIMKLPVPLPTQSDGRNNGPVSHRDSPLLVPYSDGRNKQTNEPSDGNSNKSTGSSKSTGSGKYSNLSKIKPNPKGNVQQQQQPKQIGVSAKQRRSVGTGEFYHDLSGSRRQRMQFKTTDCFFPIGSVFSFPVEESRSFSDIGSHAVITVSAGVCLRISTASGGDIMFEALKECDDYGIYTLFLSSEENKNMLPVCSFKAQCREVCQLTMTQLGIELSGPRTIRLGVKSDVPFRGVLKSSMAINVFGSVSYDNSFGSMNGHYSIPWNGPCQASS